MAKNIMIQGTSSGVGKSIITTGLCRVFKQDGISVATFKAQNMSNNSYKLDNGLEMAKSQAIAAFACGIEPTPDMNPILLKILEFGSEVIIRGKSIGSMNSGEYNDLKKNIWKEVLEPYNRLSEQYEMIVMEGAGSPVEMNLKANDVVNMGMAKKVNAPVILVVDIDRGGAFASVKGTLDLLDSDERKFVKGIVINKCRGRKESFHDVKDTMEQIVGVPVVGLVPYSAIDIEDEDDLIDAQVGVKTAKNLEHMNVQFDLLADVLRKNMDFDKIYKIIEMGV